ncbi:hypothetical protein Ssi03_34340 [Sphaerisporangium siamense]|nr:hypothetical protein Ssi03_34340 [Sphaerisporangium siamense]
MRVRDTRAAACRKNPGARGRGSPRRTAGGRILVSGGSLRRAPRVGPAEAGLTSELPEAVAVDNGGLVLLVFLAFLFAWGLNRVRRALRFGPMAYTGVMITFVIVMLAVYTQTFR